MADDLASLPIARRIIVLDNLTRFGNSQVGRLYGLTGSLKRADSLVGSLEAAANHLSVRCSLILTESISVGAGVGVAHEPVRVLAL